LNAGNLKQDILFGGMYGIAAAFFNTFLLFSPYGELTFHFGQLFVILCLITRGLFPATIACLMGAGSLSLAVGNPYFLVLLFGELWVLNWLFQRGVVVFVADLGYWVFIGVPLAYVIMYFQSNFPPDYVQLLLLKQLLNGIIYTLLAALLLVFIPLKWCVRTQKSKPMRLKTRIFYLSMITTILPALLIAILLTSRTISAFEREFAFELESAAAQLSSLSERYIRTHEGVVRQLADLLGQSAYKPEILDATQKNFPGFKTMLVTDADGQIVYGAPSEFYQRIANPVDSELRDVSDRDYYLAPRDTLSDYVSNVFQGRGFGNDMIIALSSPILVDDEFVGVVEGSLNLPRIEILQESLAESFVQRQIVITDAANQVIHTSSNVSFEHEATLLVEEEYNRYTDSMRLTLIDNQEYFYAVAENIYGWKAYVLVSPSVMTNLFSSNIFILLITLMLVSGLFLVAVARFSRQFTFPLQSLIEQFSRNERTLVPPKSLFETREVIEIGQQLQASQQVILDFNRKLEREVEDKTRELTLLNERLAQLAKRDALTGLHNRRYFDESALLIYKANLRNDSATSLVVIDIDHFKSINDNYGHPVGDECLKSVPALFNQFFSRDSDLVARYGGEEFVLLLSGEDLDSHLHQLECLRQTISSTVISVNGIEIKLTVSIGVAHVRQHSSLSFDELMRLADEALYQSKKEGRNRITYKIVSH